MAEKEIFEDVVEETAIAVNEETGEIITNDEETLDIISELTQGVQYFTTFNEDLKANDMGAIEKLMTAMLKADEELENCIGTEIYITDIVSYYQKRKNGDILPVFILFGDDGKTYVTGSIGVYNSLKKIVNIMVKLNLRENPYGVKVIKVPANDGYKCTTLQPLGFKNK